MVESDRQIGVPTPSRAGVRSRLMGRRIVRASPRARGLFNRNHPCSGRWIPACASDLWLLLVTVAHQFPCAVPMRHSTAGADPQPPVPFELGTVQSRLSIPLGRAAIAWERARCRISGINRRRGGLDCTGTNDDGTTASQPIGADPCAGTTINVRQRSEPAARTPSAGRSIHRRWPAQCASPRRAQPGPRSGRTRPRGDACA